MHELSITQSLIETVLDQTGERKVTAVNVQSDPVRCPPRRHALLL